MGELGTYGFTGTMQNMELTDILVDTPGGFPSHRMLRGLIPRISRAELLHTNLDGQTEFLGALDPVIYERSSQDIPSEVLPAFDNPGLPIPGQLGDAIYYRMRGIDSTCPEIMQPAYVYWTVMGDPDYTAAELTPAELPCGSDPLIDVVDIAIASWWTEGLGP